MTRESAPLESEWLRSVDYQPRTRLVFGPGSGKGGQINPFFVAVTSATEEAIVNAMIAAETMEGINGNKVHAIPHDRLIAVLKKYNRIK